MNKQAILFLVKITLIFIIITLISILLINASRHIINEDFPQTQNAEEPAPEQPKKSDITVVIDPGHGGIDTGAVGINGCREKEINLSLAFLLYDMLSENGYPAALTRTSDILLCDNAPSGKKKLTDLQNRINKVNEYEKSILVSLHLNTYPSEKCSGAQVYYSPGTENSAILADIIQRNIKNNLQPENNRLPKEATSSIYILHHAIKPSVLVECGFISNREEANLLCTNEYQNKLAIQIYNSIIEYLGKKNEEFEH